jgi:hypothetical protein
VKVKELVILLISEAFNNFSWCLKRTEVEFTVPNSIQVVHKKIQTENVYALKGFLRKGLLCRPRENLVTFKNHSGDFCSGSSYPC